MKVELPTGDADAEIKLLVGKGKRGRRDGGRYEPTEITTSDMCTQMVRLPMTRLDEFSLKSEVQTSNIHEGSAVYTVSMTKEEKLVTDPLYCIQCLVQNTINSVRTNGQIRKMTCSN